MSDDDRHGWNHPQCDVCWTEERGFEAVATRLRYPLVSQCCYCGQWNRSGIYRRVEPLSDRIPYCPDRVPA
jgi:hypothetical protein